MQTHIPIDDLREQIARAIAGSVKAYDVPKVCVSLGIQASEAKTDGTEAFSSKRIYVRRRLLEWDEPRLVALAAKVVRDYPAAELSDMLSEMTLHAEHRVGPLVRRDVLKALNPLGPLFGELAVVDTLRDLFGPGVIEDDPTGLLGRHSRRGQIVQHYTRNDDWSNEELLIECGALTCSQTRFFRLLEMILHPLARRDAQQAEAAAAIADALLRDGFTIHQSGAESGYPVFSVVQLRAGVEGAVKNLIFASTGEKPELIFRDAVNNDVEIVKNADKVLIFDRPLPASGQLLWKDLRDWLWRASHPD